MMVGKTTPVVLPEGSAHDGPRPICCSKSSGCSKPPGSMTRTGQAAETWTAFHVNHHDRAVNRPLLTHNASPLTGVNPFQIITPWIKASGSTIISLDWLSVKHDGIASPAYRPPPHVANFRSSLVARLLRP